MRRNHQNTKNTKSTKILIVVEPQRHRDTEMWGIRGKETKEWDAAGIGW